MNDVLMPTNLGAWTEGDMAAWRKLARAYPKTRTMGLIFDAVAAVIRPLGLALSLYRQWPNQPAHQTPKGTVIWRNRGLAVTVRSKKAVAAELAALGLEMWSDGGSNA